MFSMLLFDFLENIFLRYLFFLSRSISIRCVGKCNSNPCLNNGTWIDHYYNYLCDC